MTVKTVKLSLRHLILKKALRVFIKRFGIQLINDKLADIYYEEAEINRDYFYDDVSEAYDKINEMFRFRSVRDKK
jgi:hypothetical protein